MKTIYPENKTTVWAAYLGRPVQDTEKTRIASSNGTIICENYDDLAIDVKDLDNEIVEKIEISRIRYGDTEDACTIYIEAEETKCTMKN